MLVIFSDKYNFIIEEVHKILTGEGSISKRRVGGRAFCYQAPLLWNHLPVLVQEADTLSAFKSRLKTFLLDKAYS